MKHQLCCLPFCCSVLEPETAWADLCPGHLDELRVAFEGSELGLEDYWAEVLAFAFEEEIENDEYWAELAILRIEGSQKHCT